MATINYSDVVRVERLPIDAQDVVTNPTLVIAGNIAGEPPWQRITSQYVDGDDLGMGTVTDHVWLPVTHDYAHPDPGGLFSQRAFGLPEGLDPFLAAVDLPVEPEAEFAMQNTGTPSAVRDGDPTTYGGIPDLTVGPGTLRYGGTPPVANTNLFYGFRLVYLLNINDGVRSTYVTGTPAIATIQMATRNPFYGALVGGTPVGDDGTIYPSYATRYLWGIPETPTGEIRVVYGVTAFDARITYPDNQAVGEPLRFSVGSFQCAQQAVGGELRVIEYTPLMLNTALLDSIAAGNVRLPAMIPRRVTVSGVVSPDVEHTIVGWPGGDLTGTVAQQQYELGRTVIDFEQAGSPVGLPAEALEAARERRVAIDRAVSDAGYAVRMGERQ